MDVFDDAGAATMRRDASPLLTVSHTRVRILELVTERPLTVCDVARRLEINKSAVHKHMMRLVADRALVRSESGKWVYYKVGPAAADLLLLSRSLRGMAGAF